MIQLNRHNLFDSCVFAGVIGLSIMLITKGCNTERVQSAPPDTTIKGLILTEQQRRLDAERNAQLKLLEENQIERSRQVKKAREDAKAHLILSTSAEEWTDAIGEFSVRARLLVIDQKAGKVLLLRDGDERELKITIARLSKDNQQYVRNEMKRFNEFKKTQK